MRSKVSRFPAFGILFIGTGKTSWAEGQGRSKASLPIVQEGKVVPVLN
jgi:hypothetical protein